MAEKKTQQIGMLVKNKTKDGERTFESIQLGNLKNKDPKYNYTVQVRILDNDGNVIVTKTNPTLNLWDPKFESDWLLKNLTVDLVDKVQTQE